MKKILIILLLLGRLLGNAQTVTWQSNEIETNLNDRAGEWDILPSVKWIKPYNVYSSISETQIEIAFEISNVSSLKSAQLRILDAITQDVLASLDIERYIANSPLFERTLRLQEGQCKIEVVCQTQSGTKTFSSRTLFVGKDAYALAVSADRKDYALLFATDKYENWGDLVNPISDANTIATELKEKYKFEVEVAENFSQEEILLKIKEYSQRKFKPQDQLLIFFAGHGHFDEAFGEGYVVASNSLDNDKAKTTYISHSNLRSYINNIPCEHILLIMDVCFGGTFDPVLARRRSAESYDEINDSEFLTRKLMHKTRRYITSGGKEYVSDGIPGKHSPFAASTLEALRSLGGNDKILTLNELILYLERIKDHEPRFGSFGDNHPSSDFIFIAR